MKIDRKLSNKEWINFVNKEEPTASIASKEYQIEDHNPFCGRCTFFKELVRVKQWMWGRRQGNPLAPTPPPPLEMVISQ
jgi:hypothetical protein